MKGACKSEGLLESALNRLTAGRTPAQTRFLEWAVAIGVDEPVGTCGADKDFANDKYAIGSLSVLCVKGGLEMEGLGRRASAAERSRAEAWSARAGSYAVLFEDEVQSGTQEERVQVVIRSLIGARADAAAFIRGVAVTSAFWSLYNVSSEVRDQFESLASTTPEARAAAAYVKEWIGDIYFRGEKYGG